MSNDSDCKAAWEANVRLNRRVEIASTALQQIAYEFPGQAEDIAERALKACDNVK